MSYRLPTTELTLPYSFEDIKFPVNRIADNITFNKKIQLIDENFNKILDYCNVVINESPSTYDYIFNLSTLAITNSSTPIVESNHNYNFIEVVEKYSGEELFICCKNNQIDFYVSDVDNLDNLTLSISYTQIKNKGSLQFKNISYVKYMNEKLYVYDNVLETVFVYNLVSLLTDDPATYDIIMLKHYNKLKNVIAFDVNNKIYSITNNKLIVLNSDFSISNTYDIEESPIDIKADNSNIYILYDSFIRKYDLNISTYQDYDLNKLVNDETFLSIDFSKYDDGVVYVLTNYYIYKYKTDGVFIGYFNISTMGGKRYRDFSIVEQSENEFVFGLDQNKLHVFKDKITTIKLYDDINLSDRKDISNLQLRNLELEQDFTYNAILQKTIFNVFLLYNSLLFKPFIQTDTNGVLVYNYVENIANDTVLQKSDIFYGQNEVFSYQTFNRAFKEIYNIQERILTLIEFGVVENTTNTLII